MEFLTSAAVEPVASLGTQAQRLPFEWRALVTAWLQSPCGREVARRWDEAQAGQVQIFPRQTFRALEAVEPDAVRVVILGQDPYHGPGQAEGLAFSVPKGVPIPPSLRNIYRELERDLDIAPAPHGHLGGWAAQGVLLLNTALSVEAGRAGSHARWGWDDLTDRLIEDLARRPAPRVFMLWGAHAQAKRSLIERAALTAQGAPAVLVANHPSPLSARRPPIPFIGCGHFGLANRILEQQGGRPIEWARL